MKRSQMLSAILLPFWVAGLGLLLFMQVFMSQDAHALDCNVPTGMHPTIQSAMGDSSCDVINLTAPIYMENVIITRSVIIQGQGASTTTVDGGGNGRVFDMQPGLVVTLTDMTVRNGLSSTFEDYGAGIYNPGSQLTIQNSEVVDNSAPIAGGIYNAGFLTVLSTTVGNNAVTSGQGGGILNEGGTVTILNSQIISNYGNFTVAGGIWNDGVMAITDSLVAGNRTMLGDGGGIANRPGAVLTITGSTIDRNVNWFGQFGGGILNSGMLWLINSTVSNNQASSGSIGTGGGIANSGILTVESSTFWGNHSGFRGGGIANIGDGTLAIHDSNFSHNSGAGSGVTNNSSQPVLIMNTTFSNNTNGGISNEGTLLLDHALLENNNGSGIRNGGILTVTSSLLIGNSGTNGGGLHNAYGSATVINSHFEQNSAAEEGGAINNSHDTVTLINSTLYSNTANNGGGIANGEAAFYIIDSTLYQNHADAGGGGIYSSRQKWLGVVIITNTTVSNNSAPLGGGVYNWGIFTSINSTINGNAANTGGGIYSYQTTGSAVQVANTMIANSVSGGDCGGNQSITSWGYNLASDTTCNLTGPGDLPDTDPLLGPLQDNGGATWTHALLPGSPAVDAGNDSACPQTDQRGVTRPIGDHCDIGAYEYEFLLTAVNDTATTQPNTPVLIDVLANDGPSLNGDPALDSVGVPMNGTAVISGTFVLYTPTLDFIGTDTFTYTITDGVLTDTAVVTVTVLPLVGPTAVSDTVTTTQNTAALLDVLANDLPGSSGDPVLDGVGMPMNGTAVISGTFVLYTPALDFTGTDTFTYTITDGVLTDTAVVTVTVLPLTGDYVVYLPVVLKPEE